MPVQGQGGAGSNLTLGSGQVAGTVLSTFHEEVVDYCQLYSTLEDMKVHREVTNPPAGGAMLRLESKPD